VPGPQGIQGIQGPPGLGITFRGSVATVADLPATAAQGDLYNVENPTPAHGWVWDDEAAAWTDAGQIQGPQGIEGPASTVPGPQGPAGADSVVPGPAGPAGPAGADGKDSTVPGPAGPTAVSADAGNTSKLGTDGLIFTPAGTGGGGDYLPLAGGTMTGAITLPSGVNGLTIKGTNYNMLGGSGGVAFRNGTANIINFTGGEVVAYVPITTAGTGIGVRFGSGGPTLSKSGTMIAASAPITVAAAPANPTELANKAYVDSKVPVNAVAGSRAGLTLWTGTQAEYDAIATKNADTVYAVV
jgi:hypothetical protein